ncbi:GIY-YIG nuclease family protein [Candidatus Bathyarchaeota archaeon]|nr:GIY-YIG nuclease family protein [Candidatus Bathyarchaeota archaeon]NIU81287.1 GIY-YIG nuclease family protein [Candidatus Bathyarchaeota archaeon]NIV67922.1 GIY-YIG nuclease family protein [Candidatus Bathyarchaeota archaeon]NIW16363.1 GIY-YIG nuclease family protein [Candidatus Bathyarchaeota archaeon]
MPYYVYILLCQDDSYYTGYTKDVEQRMERHRKGLGARYTRMHKPEEIAYLEEFESRGQAMKREREIKSFSHDRKQRLADSYGEAGSTTCQSDDNLDPPC